MNKFRTKKMATSASCLPLIQPTSRSGKGIQDSPDYGELSSISSIQNKDSIVRIILASGMVDAYDTVISAYSVMQKYPRLCLARPEVFRSPHNSIVGPNEMLFPGEKFYLVPRTTVRKLLDKTAVKDLKVEKIEAVKAAKERDQERDEEGSASCSAKDFYSSNDKWRNGSRMRKKSRKGVKEEEEKKTFRPITKKDLFRWRPTLPPIDEISP